ncbi:acyl carrier protein [Pseudomonas sp. DTU12.3]|uniref:acyl carrier protein n=1 Tax=Pseudomonas sp. DTU12.3 TaxID=2073078 RepID=UPI00101255E0|nr:acyl carrier protein [Pseudomonas sp. DTU12.3]QAX83772.1 acyl carrier protein [Pseudomonas sp. DTU12.3]
MGDFESRLTSVIAVRLDKDEAKVVLSSRFIEDLNVDSVDAVELILDLEEEFGIEIPDQDAEKVKTVKDVLDFLRAHA